MHTGSFLISANSHVYRKLLLQKSIDFFIFGTMAWLFSTICKAYRIVFIFEAAWLNGGAIQPLTRDEKVTELGRDPTVVPHASVQSSQGYICIEAQMQDSQEKDV